MQEFRDINKTSTVNLPKLISELNNDQKRVFDKVINTINSDTECLRYYVSGEGGTGKSHLIKVIKCWVQETLKKDVAIVAPTGIAALNIDGLTFHRLFQLPVEHGYTPKYRQLSDAVLKTLRDELKNTILFIIDEISMVSNITFMYINLRLIEIFNTFDGWFGRKHILLFGDLLQLPPVHEEPAFIKINKQKAEKYLGSLGATNIWNDLFTYDELGINMRQQDDVNYREILSRIRLGIVTDYDTKILNSKKINFVSTLWNEKLNEICNYLTKLSSDTVCLLPTRDPLIRVAK
ncbi:ATP-dependent DNA helicase PIF1 [Cyphomyrmex costatus]|uniref:ATP-dependent DNA helicase n=1 Tax=Cyphomyrmex costatus TaxID=456900 RepID=A0A151IDG4_9HYME|nr:ATP-dependent DNA helicase PIF1 [Cyphomyrmex costatus]